MKIMTHYWNRVKTTNSTLTELLFSFDSPRQMARSVTIGFFIGIFPVVGVTTILCLLAIFAFRLNSLATIGTNFLVSPIQVALLYPFWQIGQYLSPSSANSKLELPEARLNTLSANWSLLSEWLFGAILAWAFFSLIGGLLFYFILRRLQMLHAAK